jgi:hypothetical protein
MEPRPFVTLDADVLIPVLSCDFLLSCFEAGLYVPTVTPKILAEVRNNLIENFSSVDPERLRVRADQIAATLKLHVQADRAPNDEVRATVNEKDRHVAMSAIGEPQGGVVNNDKRLRTELAKLDPPVTAWSVDQFALHLRHVNGLGIDEALRMMVLKRTRPAVTLEQILDQLKRTLPKFVQKVKLQMSLKGRISSRSEPNVRCSIDVTVHKIISKKVSRQNSPSASWVIRNPQRI